MRVRRPTRGLRWYFDHNDGRLIDKWLHYFPIYDEFLGPFRNTAPTMLEIGVYHGGSLEMWRHYLGRKATIVGLDNDPRAAELASDGIDVVIGDQSDPGVLAGLVERYGAFDVVLDDGSHFPQHQIASITHLWPHVVDGGVYIVEDLHTNYWADYGGARGRDDTFVAWLHGRLDDLHAFHSEDPAWEPDEWTRTLGAVHVYDSVAILGKEHRSAPVRRRTGRPSFDDFTDDEIDEHHRSQLEALNGPTARLRRAWRDPGATLRRATDRLRPSGDDR